MAGIATKESLSSLFGQKAQDKSGYLFPYLCGASRDVEPVDSVRVRYPLVFASKMVENDGTSTSNRITKYVSCESKDMETHIDLTNAELRDGSVAQQDGAANMVDESYSFWDEGAIAAFEANENAFDGAAYFGTHYIAGGTSGDTQANLIDDGVAVVVDPTAPTADEAAAILDSAIDVLASMQDLKGKLVNQAMREIIVVVGSAKIAKAFKSAINTVAGAAKSASVNLGTTVTVVQKTGITAGNVYVLRGDANSKTVVMQESAPETAFDESDTHRPFNRFQYKSERGVGLGVYYNAVLVQMSAAQPG